MDHSTITAKQIHYPESDGKPTGETDVHNDGMINLREALRTTFEISRGIRGREYVAVLRRGEPRGLCSAGCLRGEGVDKRERRTYRLREEGQPPAVVFEITSRGSRLEDLGTKRAVYAMLGVREYFLYDPLGEYLRPPLQGYRLQEGSTSGYCLKAKGGSPARPWVWSCGWRMAVCGWSTL